MNSASRAATLTHSLLAFARRQSLGRQITRHQRSHIRHPGNCPPPSWREISPWISHLIPNSGPLLRTPINSRTRFSISPSTPATPCRKAGGSASRRVNATIDAASTVHDGEIASGDYVVVSVTDTGSRHDTGCHGESLRAVLHDQTHRARHGARPVDDLWLRQAVGWPRPYHERGWSRHDGKHLSSPRARIRGSCRRGAQPMPPEAGARLCWSLKTMTSVRFTVTELLKELGYTYLACRRCVGSAIPYLAIETAHRPAFDGRWPAEYERPPTC